MSPNSKRLSRLSTEDITDDHNTQTHQETSEPSSLGSPPQNKCDIKGFLRRNAFVLLTVAAIVIGIGLGFALQSCNLTARNIKYFTFPGKLLLRMLQSLVFPLIISSLITGVSSVKWKTSSKMGLQAICYYIITTAMAVFTGIVLVVLVQPGKSPVGALASSGGKVKAVQTVDAFLDLIRNMFPSNLVAVCFRKDKTVYPKSLGVVNLTQTNDTVLMTGTSDGVNILGLLVFCISFGLVLSNKSC